MMLALVVDTNVLVTYFWKDSLTKRLFAKFKLLAPEYVLEEINKHSSEILQKTELSLKEFRELRKELSQIVEFISLQEYKTHLKQASKIPDKDDIDFIALALKLKVPIWSNDKLLKGQSLVAVFTTEELIKLLPFL